MSDLVREFITQRQYLKNVTPRTLGWYEQSFKRFDGAIESRAMVIARITELRQAGVKAISVNTYLRCINAYFRWLHIEHGRDLLRIPRLQEDKKVLATFSPDQVKRLTGFKPRGANAIRAQLIACVVLDCGLRIGEVLTLTWDQVDLDNLSLKVKGKGSKERVVPISFELRKLLFRCPRKPNWPLVFSTRSGNRLSQRNTATAQSTYLTARADSRLWTAFRSPISMLCRYRSVVLTDVCPKIRER